MTGGTAADESGPRRFLIATSVSHYPQAPEWDRPGLVDARRTMVELFTTQLGYEHVSDLGANPTEHQLLRELREFCRAPQRRPDDIVAVYIAAHGELLDNDEYVLLTSDTSPDDLHDGLQPSVLARKILAGTKVRRLLLMLDTCFSGQGGNELLAAMARLKNGWRERDAGLAVITSAQPYELAQTGAFPKLLAEAVTSLATAGYTPELLSLDAVVSATTKNPGRPGFQHIGLEIIGLTGEIPPFLPNAKHSPRLSHTDMALQQAAEWDEQDKRRDVEFRTRLLRRAMGHRDEDRVGWWFSGRHRALREITQWLRELPADRPALVVTAGPGSGKTAVLGLLAAVSDPEYRRTVPLSSLGLNAELLPPPKAIRTAVYAQNLTDQQVVRALAAALRMPAVDTVADLLNHLDAGPQPDRPQVVLIDGLDEAATPSALCSQVLRPLMELARPRLRLLLGTRPHLLTPLGLERRDHIDLDSARYADQQAVLAYTVRNLIDAHPRSPYLACENTLMLKIAKAVAGAAGHSFLVARITAGTLAATPTLPDPWDAAWRMALPRQAADAMHHDLHQRFGTDASRILDLLRPLAYAEGQGLPWEDIWAPLASELSRRRYTNEDLRLLRQDAGAYVVEAAEDGRSVYRLYHEAMAEYLRQGHDAEHAHRAFTKALRSAVPYRLDGTPDWARAHPYALRHLATHAAEAALLDSLVTETEYLVHADTDTLVPHLWMLDSDAARLHAAIYRASLAVHRHLDVAGRRQVLALDAARFNEPSVLKALSSPTHESAWRPVAASGSLLAGNLRNAFAGHHAVATAVACAVVEDRQVAVTGSFDGTVLMWDLITGQPVGLPMTGHTDSVEALACTTLDGRPVAVTGSADATVRVWDLSTGRPVGPPLTGHTQRVDELACATLNGRPVAVTGSDDGTMRVWDLSTGQTLHVRDLGGIVTALAVAVTDGRTIVVTGSIGSTLRLWDLESCRELRTLADLNAFLWIRAMACTELDGHPVVVAWEHDEKMHVWDLETRRRLTSFPAHGDVYMVACTHLDGRAVAITCSDDNAVRVWDLKAGRQVSNLQGHTNDVTSLACTSLAGQPVVVGGSNDAVRVWDLSVQRTFGRPVIGHTQWIGVMDQAEVKGQPVVVTGSDDDTVRLWDVTTGLPVGDALRGHADRVWSVACTVREGRPVAVSSSLDYTIQRWDLEALRSTPRQLALSRDPVTNLWCATVGGLSVVIGTPLLDSESFRVGIWDLETGEPVHPPLELDQAWRAAAATVLDGRPVAVVTDEQTMQVWELATRRRVTEIPQGAISIACGEMKGRPVLVTGAEDNAIRVWDPGTGRPIGQPMTGHSRPAFSVTCGNLDGRPVAVTCSGDNTVRLWDLESCKAVGTVHVPSPSQALLVENSGRLAVAFGTDVAFFTRK